MNWLGIVLGLILGALAGCAIGKYSVYFSLNKTNLIGDDDFGKDELQDPNKLSGIILGMFAGVVFAGIGIVVFSISVNEGLFDMVGSNSDALFLPAVGVVFLAFGILALGASISTLLKN